MRTAAQRTRLAWERTALGPLATAGLLLAKRVDAELGLVLLAAADVVLALLLIGLGRRRQRRISGAGDAAAHAPGVPDPVAEVVGAAVAAAAMAVATAVLVAVVA